MEAFGKFMTVLLAMIISPIIGGFVIMKLWDWFIIPIFDIHPLRLVEGIALVLIFSYIKADYKKTTTENFWEDFIAKCLFVVTMAAFALFAGWIIHLFM
jgi:hypothetical protein